jgi:type IV pilus assembly protein PilA
MKKGFTLIEMMIVVAIIAIIAAIAIPSLIAARRNSFDTAGAANCRAYATAQTMYIKTDWDGNGTKEYANPFANLYSDATAAGKMHKLIDKGFNDAVDSGHLKQGYYFGDLATVATVAINWAADYGLCGAPGAYDRTGTRLYVVGSDGRPLCTDAPNVQAGATAGTVIALITDYPSAAQITAQFWAEAD